MSLYVTLYFEFLAFIHKEPSEDVAPAPNTINAFNQTRHASDQTILNGKNVIQIFFT